MLSTAIHFTGQDAVQVVRERAVHPGPDEVLIAARRSLISTGTEGICLSRLFEPGSHWDRWVQYPFAPGYSMVGQVVAVGQNVTRFRGLEHVAVRAPHQQYVTVNAARAVPVPEGVPDEDAAWFALGAITQIGVRRAAHALGESVAVIGLGPLGQLVTQYARLLGARAVIAVDTAESRLQVAERHGATALVRATAAGAAEEVVRLADGLGVEVAYDVTGNAAVFPHALRMLRRFGRLVLLGDTGTPSEQHLTSDLITRGLAVLGAHDNNPPSTATEHACWSHEAMWRLFFTYLRRGDMRVSDLITHRVDPCDAPSVYAMLRERRAETMGVVFDWSGV